jgi:hypothetical protein
LTLLDAYHRGIDVWIVVDKKSGARRYIATTFSANHD